MTPTALARIPARMRVLAVAAGFAAACVPALAQWTSPADGTMPEDLVPQLKPILINALRQSPTALQANIDMAIADYNRYIARAAYWPQLNASGGYNETWAQSSGSASTQQKGGSYNIGLNRDIFEWGADKYRADIGAIQKKIADRNFAIAYKNLAVSLRQSYMLLIIKRATIANAKYALDRQKKLFEDVKDKVKQGLLFPNSIGPMQLSVDELQMGYDKMVSDFGYMKRSFMHQAGLDALPDEEIPDHLPRPNYNAPLADALLSQYIAGGVDETLESKQMEMQITIAHKQYLISKYSNYPKVSFNANYNLSFNTNATANSVQISQVKEGTAGLNASWNVFDGLATHYNKLSSLAQIRSLEYQKKLNDQNAIDNASKEREQIGFLARATAIQMVRGDLGDNGVHQISEEVKRGEASQDLLENQIIQSQQAHLFCYQSFVDFLGAWTDYVAAVGKDPAIEYLDPRYVR